VTAFVITAAPGGKSVRTSVVTSFLVGGLTDGTAYRFTVRAVSKNGTGPGSRPSAAVTPKAPAAPGAPRLVTATPGFKQVSVTWAAPASDGGAPITSYRISASPAVPVVSVAGSARSAVVAGLADGTPYKVLVSAVSSAGASKPGTASPVTPGITVPGVPAGVTAAPAASGVTVGWTPPLSDGGSAVTGYVITVAGTTRTVTAAAAARSATVSGLAVGTFYAFTVAAVNAKGKGPSPGWRPPGRRQWSCQRRRWQP
jgi:hypothetical protein